ncbi:MAG: hypothetical protein ABL907_07430 [Hyphomicrobium sp.]
MMINTPSTIERPLVISVADDLRIFDAFSPRVRDAFNYAPVKLAATPKVLLLSDETILTMIATATSRLIERYPPAEPLRHV